MKANQSTEQPDPAKKTIRSFVIRGGRMTPSQQSALDSQWQKRGMELQDGACNFVDQFGNAQPVVLEIGFGMGDSLADMAGADSETNYIGIEVHRPGVGRLLSLADKRGLDNIRVYNDDAVEVLKHCIPIASLSRVNIYFPDPWHKKKHHKRRLIQQPFVDLLIQRLHAGGLLHIATDWQHYAEHIVELMQSQSNLENLAAEQVYSNAEDYGRPMTKFERRGRKLGHGVWDMVYRKLD